MLIPERLNFAKGFVRVHFSVEGQLLFRRCWLCPAVLKLFPNWLRHAVAFWFVVAHAHDHSPLPFPLRRYCAISVGHFDVLQDLGSEVVTAFARMRTSTVPFGACGSSAFHATENLDSPQLVFDSVYQLRSARTSLSLFQQQWVRSSEFAVERAE